MTLWKALERKLELACRRFGHDIVLLQTVNMVQSCEMQSWDR